MKASDMQQHWIEGCPSGKRGFIRRAGAKDAAQSLAKAGSPGTRPYRCDQCDYWHIGHKPAPVMRGEVSTTEWYGRTH